MSSSVALELRKLSKQYRVYASSVDRLKELLFGGARHQNFSALQSTDLEVREGEVLGILGRNGAGKSTLLQLIAGTLTPTTGTIKINGKVVALLELGSGFNVDFTGRENIFLYGSIMGMTRADVSTKFPDIVAFADIGQFIDQPLRTYSSGMVVRLAFSTIAHLDPDILIVDEALAVGDAQFQMKCLQRINALKSRGKTFLLVSHSIDQVSSFCTRAIVLERGEIIFDGAPRDAGHVYRALLFSGGREKVLDEINKPKSVLSESRKSVRLVQATSTSEFRFGHQRARIETIELLSSENGVGNVFATNEHVTLQLKVVANETIKTPIYGFRVRNLKGVDIYIKNTLHERFGFPPLKPGETCTIVIPFTLALVGGEYFISASIAEVKDGQQIAVDRRMDALQFTVVSADGCAGVANLNASFTISDLSARERTE